MRSKLLDFLGVPDIGVALNIVPRKIRFDAAVRAHLTGESGIF